VRSVVISLLTDEPVQAAVPLAPDIDDESLFTYSIDDPELGHRYCVYWT
jgi:hypothetical protein